MLEQEIVEYLDELKAIPNYHIPHTKIEEFVESVTPMNDSIRTQYRNKIMATIWEQSVDSNIVNFPDGTSMTYDVPALVFTVCLNDDPKSTVSVLLYSRTTLEANLLHICNQANIVENVPTPRDYLKFLITGGSLGNTPITTNAETRKIVCPFIVVLRPTMESVEYLLKRLDAFFFSDNVLAISVLAADDTSFWQSNTYVIEESITAAPTTNSNALLLNCIKHLLVKSVELVEDHLLVSTSDVQAFYDEYLEELKEYQAKAVKEAEMSKRMREATEEMVKQAISRDPAYMKEQRARGTTTTTHDADYTPNSKPHQQYHITQEVVDKDVVVSGKGRDIHIHLHIHLPE